MKKYPALSLITVITALTLCGCGQETPEGTEKAKPNYKPLSDSSEAVKKAEEKDKSRPKTHAPAAKPQEAETQDISKSKTSTATGVSSVVDYATGMTQLNIKQSSEKRIKNVQDSHNQTTQKAIDEN